MVSRLLGADYWFEIKLGITGCASAGLLLAFLSKKFPNWVSNPSKLGRGLPGLADVLVELTTGPVGRRLKLVHEWDVPRGGRAGTGIPGAARRILASRSWRLLKSMTEAGRLRGGWGGREKGWEGCCWWCCCWKLAGWRPPRIVDGCPGPGPENLSDGGRPMGFFLATVNSIPLKNSGNGLCWPGPRAENGLAIPPLEGAPFATPPDPSLGGLPLVTPNDPPPAPPRPSMSPMGRLGCILSWKKVTIRCITCLFVLYSASHRSRFANACHWGVGQVLQVGQGADSRQWRHLERERDQINTHTVADFNFSRKMRTLLES